MAGPPGKPSVTVQSRVAALYVSWTLEDDGGSSITEYQVQWKSGAQSFDSSRQQAGLTATNTLIETLINGTEYDVPRPRQELSRMGRVVRHRFEGLPSRARGSH